MPRIYTEFRIAHESQSTKEQLEKDLDEAIRVLGYRNRIEWLNAMVGVTVINADKKRARLVQDRDT